MAHLKVSARELRGQLTILAVVLWATALVNVWTPTLYLRSGQVKGTDFVHFYTLAWLAAEGRYSDLLDSDAIRRAQLDLVPESKADFYPAFYGPQVGVMLAPLGRLSYTTALLAWSLVIAAAYVVSMTWVVLRTSRVRSHWPLALLAAVAFPPFWLLVQHGHPTVSAMVAFVFAWRALHRGNPMAAGVFLGLLAYKPPLVVPLAAVLLLSGSWRILAGLAVGAVLQFVPAWLTVGPSAFGDYLSLVLELSGEAPNIVAKPELFHGWRGFWLLLVPNATASLAVYAASAVVTVVVAARAWGRRHDSSMRMAVLGLATGLAAPHLYAYDLVVLAPVWLWLTDWYLAQSTPSRLVGRALYLGFLAPLIGPLVALLRIQILTPILMVLLVELARGADAEPGRGAPAGG